MLSPVLGRPFTSLFRCLFDWIAGQFYVTLTLQSVYMASHLVVCLSLCVTFFVCLFVCLFICLSLSFSVLPVLLSVCLSVSVSVLSVYLCRSVCISVSVSLALAVPLLSVCLLCTSFIFGMGHPFLYLLHTSFSSHHYSIVFSFFLPNTFCYLYQFNPCKPQKVGYNIKVNVQNSQQADYSTTF